MAEAIDIRELNERIERQSAFVTNLMTGMDQVIVGQKHLVESLLIGLLSDGHILLEGVPLEEWALTDPKYTDSETGISWYIRDGKYPYMVGEDAEKFRKLCEESGEFPLKKFGEMTGLIQKLDDNTVAYVGDNGIAVKSKDGKEMFVDTSGLSYDIVMDMFRNLPRNGNFFSNKYWSDNIQKAQARS